MAEYEDTSAALRRLEAALNRIAAQVAKPRPISASVSALHESPESGGIAEESADAPPRHEIVTKLDDLISGLRNALGGDRPS